MKLWRDRFRPRRRTAGLLPALLAGVLLVTLVVGMVRADPPVIDSCPVFPADNAWNTDISDAPVHPLSKTYINNINANGSDFVHPDFGEDPSYGIPWLTVDDTQPLVPVTFEYDDESDPGPYPIPPDAPVEDGNDRHVLVVETTNCILYETYASEYVGGPDNAWTAGSGAIFDLNSNDLRPDGWTSADAAGLPILPGLARCDEVMNGEITHALRFTVSETQRAYVYPATHFASSNTDPAYPPLGLRFRLKADYDLSGLSGQALVIATALKKYGMILADNGSNWYISGETNPSCWNDDELNQLKDIPGTAFEVVESPPPPTTAGELLANGGFEGAALKKLPAAWKGKNISKDKRVCDVVSALDGVIKEVSPEGWCAFTFKGVAGESAKLEQAVTPIGVLSGDTIALTAQISGKNVPTGGGNLTLKVTYTDASKAKFTLNPDPGTYEFAPYSLIQPLEQDVSKFKLQIKYKGTSGKLSLDAVSLSESVPVRNLIPLPAGG